MSFLVSRIFHNEILTVELKNRSSGENKYSIKTGMY